MTFRLSDTCGVGMRLLHAEQTDKKRATLCWSTSVTAATSLA